MDARLQRMTAVTQEQAFKLVRRLPGSTCGELAEEAGVSDEHMAVALQKLVEQDGTIRKGPARRCDVKRFQLNSITWWPIQ